MSETECGLAITQRPDPGGPLLLHVAGALDHHTAHRLREVFAAVPFDTTPSVVVDLSGLEYCDSTGLTVLITAYHEAVNAGSALRVAGARPAQERVFRVTGIDRVIPLHPTLEHAMDHLRR
ncbi:STAS domain-containing protein [Streptomyces marincola]|uniref:STAS domain-containing protein n=1 Tax=Streptomyces marincola TaxID=2878388 RepID=UPI001CF37639|nr:STAS domain-containing protein [Streptomyces marincola]UCM91623.1 STAS domain-containing protein [Streptomyces marincola]